MKIEQTIWTKENGWLSRIAERQGKDNRLVMVFAATDALKETKFYGDLKKICPSGHFLGCSTAGEICGTRVLDDSIVVTCIDFENSHFEGSIIKLNDVEGSFQAGERLANSIEKEGLIHVFVLSDGLNVNGSELVEGLTSNLPENVSVTGGLAGNGPHFEETYVFWDGLPERNTIAIVGFYGDNLKIGYGSMGGWDPFGPERLITKSKGNVLLELDNRSALEIYKLYLGDHAKELPATGLYFPLSIRTKAGDVGIVRTILAVDEENQSMTFAGDVPEGAFARFMKANFERLIDGSQDAARTSRMAIKPVPANLAILISCVGRKLVLKQRTEEEVEAAQEILGKQAYLTGFYSYGEISPFAIGAKCALHNQTMTITTLAEV